VSAAAVLAKARAAGVELLIHDGRLASRGPTMAALRDAIRVHKPALVALLTGKPAPSNWPELPPLPVDDEHARWLRGEVGTCGHCRRPVTEREVVDIGHGQILHHACGRWVRPAA
jgi:hypothetical protein